MLVVGLFLLGCGSEDHRVRPGMPRHYKVAGPSFSVGNDLVVPGVDLLFSPPPGLRALDLGSSIEWTLRNSEADTSTVFISVRVGVPLAVLDEPCGRPPDGRKSLERSRVPSKGGFSVLCDVNIGDGHQRVIRLRKSVNWAVSCQIELGRNESAISAEDAFAICDTLQVIGTSEFTHADEKKALEGFDREK